MIEEATKSTWAIKFIDKNITGLDLIATVMGMLIFMKNM